MQCVYVCVTGSVSGHHNVACDCLLNCTFKNASICQILLLGNRDPWMNEQNEVLTKLFYLFNY